MNKTKSGAAVRRQRACPGSELSDVLMLSDVPIMGQRRGGNDPERELARNGQGMTTSSLRVAKQAGEVVVIECPSNVSFRDKGCQRRAATAAGYASPVCGGVAEWRCDGVTE
jgi:hypothetical protein